MTGTGRRRRTVGALVALAALVGLVGCGGDDDGGPSASASTAARSGTATPSSDSAAFDPDGVLRVGYNLGNFSPDPSMAPLVTQQWMHHLVAGTLLQRAPDGDLRPGLATRADLVDPRTIEVELRPGLTYQDGTPLDAEAVKAGVARNLASPRASSAYVSADFRSFGSIEVLSETTFRIHLTADVAGSFYGLLAQSEFATLSPASTPPGVYPATEIVGAGPYRFVSLEPDAKLTLERWDGYFDADNVKIKRVEVVHVVGEAATTAARSGAVDYLIVTPAVAAQLGDTVTTEFETPPDVTTPIYMACKTYEPLRDARVRKALSLGIDREAINEALYAGEGEPLDTMFGSAHPWYDAALAGTNTRDVARARQLLDEAGYDELELEMFLSSPDIETTQLAEIITANLAEIGVRLSVVQTQSSTIVQQFYLDKSKPLYLAPRPGWQGLERLTINYLPGGIGNTCQVGQPANDGTPPAPEELELLDLVARLRAMDPRAPEAQELWAQIQELDAEQTWLLWVVAPPVGHAFSDEVGGAAMVPMSTGHRAPDVINMFIRKA